VANHPDPDVVSAEVVQKMIGKTLQITAPKTAPIKMVSPRALQNSADSDLKLREEVFPELLRDVIVLPQNFVQVRLNPLMKPKLHVREAR
jgi:hypothetical protein